MGGVQPRDGGQDPRRKVLDALPLRRCKRVGIGPEQAERFGIRLHQRGGALPFPGAEMQFLQITIHLHRHTQLLAELFSEPRATLQG
ncbi:hypothetical protein D3C73_1022300 [compost metagenome]